MILSNETASLVLAVGLLTAAGAQGQPAPLPGQVRSFIEKRCTECHDADTKKGNLDLTALPADFANAEIFARWVKVHDRVRAGEMPPKKKEQPSAKERDTALQSLAQQLTTADTTRQRQEGRVAMRRLNRTEYENTMRDLFSLPGLALKELLPEDGRQDGFDKSSTALDVSAVQMRKYLETADFTLDTAIAHQEKPIVWSKRMRRIGGLHQFGEACFPINNGRADMFTIQDMWRKRDDGRNMPLQVRQPLLEACESVGILSHARPSFIPEIDNFGAFHPGFYRIKTSVWSFHYDHRNNPNGELKPAVRQQSLALTAEGRVLAYLDAPSLKPTEHELVVWLNAGESLELNPANLWGNFNSPLNYVGPGVAVDYVDVEGPLHDTWPPASHKRLFGDLPIAKLNVRKDQSPPESYPRQPQPPKRRPGARPHHVDGPEFNKWQPVWTAASPRPAEDAERLLKDFLPRAFRRPVADDEVQVYVKIARDELAKGEFFESAMRVAYRTALCSPDFLFINEPPGVRSKTDPMALDLFAVASRLSYFLWNSMPDEELFALARDNKLVGKTLLQQMDRMLADPKSDRFVEDFLDQWVELRKIDATTPDVKLYPEYRPDLGHAMLAETRAFFREMIKDDLGIAYLADSDFLTINQRMAEHYEIPGVVGTAVRRVPKPAGSPRGGLITQAAILKVTANGTTTSPVTRGAWVMDRILGMRPAPPPPDITTIDPDVRGAVTIRQQLDKHRNSERCAACHAIMDPPGFALESFDIIGGWRTQYRFVGEKADDPTERLGDDPDPDRFLGVLNWQWEHVLNNVRMGLAVDASGTTTDGRGFKDIHEFRSILLGNEEQMARAFVNRLVLYGTGAQVGFTDRTQVDAILKKSEAGKYGVRTLIHEVISNNPLFQRK